MAGPQDARSAVAKEVSGGGRRRLRDTRRQVGMGASRLPEKNRTDCLGATDALRVGGRNSLAPVRPAYRRQLLVSMTVCAIMLVAATSSVAARGFSPALERCLHALTQGDRRRPKTLSTPCSALADINPRRASRTGVADGPASRQSAARNQQFSVPLHRNLERLHTHPREQLAPTARKQTTRRSISTWCRRLALHNPSRERASIGFPQRSAVLTYMGCAACREVQ